MGFPGDLIKEISRFFNGDEDEILLFILIFLFFFFIVKNDTDIPDGEFINGGIIPVILIIVFLVLRRP